MKILTDTLLSQFIQDNHRTHRDGLDLQTFIQPASLDLPVGAKIYHVKHPFLAFNHTVQYITDHLCVQKLDCTSGCTLYKQQTYLIPCAKISVPHDHQWRISPKSSLGRIDVHIRAMIDHGKCYDFLPANTDSVVWLQVTPQSFNIHLTAWQTLTQIMIGKIEDCETKISTSPPQVLYTHDATPLSQTIIDDHLLISTSIPNPSHHTLTVWYKARTTDEIIDLNTIRGHAPHRFFDELIISWWGDWWKVNLEKWRFYILASKEYFQVPLEYSLELLPSSHLIGEMRAHYAWFFDPGFGLDCPAQGVLEVRPYEDMIIYDWQPICLIKIFENLQNPSKWYGKAKVANNYQWQSGAKLAKYFG